MVFTYIGFAVAAIGTALGGLMVFQSFWHFGIPQVSDQLFRGGAPVLLGAVVIGILAEISMSLRKK